MREEGERKKERRRAGGPCGEALLGNKRGI